MDDMGAFVAGQNSMCHNNGYNGYNNGDCWGGGCIWIFLILAVFMFNGNGWGNNGWGNNGCNSALESANQGALTRTTMFEGFNTNDIMRNQSDLIRGQYDLQHSILENRFETQRETCDNQKEILESRFTTQLGFQQLQAQNDRCCCELKTAIHAEGEATRALIAANAMQDIRDRLQRADNEIQTNTLINAMNKTPVPAYLTCSPYANTYNPYMYGNGYCNTGCNNGCGTC